MAEPLRSLHPVNEADKDQNHQNAASTVSPASSSRRSISHAHVSPIKDFSPANIFRRQGYQRMPSDGAQELTTLDYDHFKQRDAIGSATASASGSPEISSGGGVGAGGLGISGQQLGSIGHSRSGSASKRSSFHRVPVGSKGMAGLHNSPPDTPRSHHEVLGSISNSAASTPMIGAAVSGDRSGQTPMSMSTHPRSMSSWDGMSTVYGGASPGQDPDDPKRLLDTPATMVGTPGPLDPRGDFHDDDNFDDELFYKGFGQPPSACSSKGDIHAKRTSWLSITIFLLSIYSTVMSGIWLVVAIIQPRWGHGISSQQGLNPSTATTVCALVAKTIEMSFVTVFVSFLGQVLTRRAFVRKTSGMTLGEMTMRNWVFQPGSLITHAETVPSAGMTILGALSLTATVAATFYTTASDSMVAPKLKYGGWESKELSGYYHTSYANAQYVKEMCPSLLTDKDKDHAHEACMNVQFSGQSYRNLMDFMDIWTDIKNNNETGASTQLSDRPAGTTLLYDNTTMEAAWIETHASDVKRNFEEYSRIVNNVTMAMPHPGVYAAATSKLNGILQPDDLAGVGEYKLKAGVVAPSINVLCVNMNAEELEPLVFTEWPDIDEDEDIQETGVGDQVMAEEGWDSKVPVVTEDEYLNSTDVDDIFRWGEKYNRRPPVFPGYPADYNMIVNSSVYMSDSIYIMAKKVSYDNYTLCELRSWLSPNCSTRFDISGTSGAHMSAHCEDADDEDNYARSFEKDTEWSEPAADWKWLADAWRLSMDLNGGIYNNNASNARIISQLALTEESLPSSLPSMAEALAVYASSTLTTGAIDTPFRHYWDHDKPILDAPGEVQSFNASVKTQQYTSGHINDWQSIFYIILVLVFAINLFCLVYFILRSGLVTDFTEPQNLFALAVNSPPSEQLNGSCGAGPVKRDLTVPWRVAFAPSANHYFFEEADGTVSGGKGKGLARGEMPGAGQHLSANASGRDLGRGDKEGRLRGASYKRLSSGKGWLYGF